MILNTRNDYLNYLEINPELGKKELQYLLDSRYAWFNTMVFDTPDIEYPIDDTHRLLKNDDEYLYQEYKEDENAKLFAIGFTVAEVEELINEN